VTEQPAVRAWIDDAQRETHVISVYEIPE